MHPSSVAALTQLDPAPVRKSVSGTSLGQIAESRWRKQLASAPAAPLDAARSIGISCRLRLDGSIGSLRGGGGKTQTWQAWRS
jgi:hypothetical protein